MTKRLTKTIPPKKGPKSQGMNIPYGKTVPVGAVPEDKKRKRGYGIVRRSILMQKWIKDLWEQHPKKKWLVIGVVIGWVVAQYI